MIDTVVFDVGNVLVDWNYLDHLDSLGFSQETKDAVVKAVFRNPVWRRLDEGTMTETEALAAFIRKRF